jgi:hypothetical protein
MSVRERLTRLWEVIADEADRNSAFRRRLEEALSPKQMDLPSVQEDRVRETTPRDKPPTESARRGGRRAPAVLDPLQLARQGENMLRSELSLLTLEQLKDIVAEYGMDPGKLVMKWKDSTRVIGRIVDLSLARSTKGDAFRADKLPPTETPGE